MVGVEGLSTALGLCHSDFLVTILPLGLRVARRDLAELMDFSFGSVSWACQMRPLPLEGDTGRGGGVTHHKEVTQVLPLENLIQQMWGGSQQLVF